ncbi:MAG: sodium-dependent transporter [Halodesulfurarchaeum sp.]
MTEEASTAREEWGTRFGFMMAMIGAMVGSGNIWRMPYTTGMNGGGAFLLAYFILLYVIAVPGLMAETMIGRYTQKGVIGTFKEIFDNKTLRGLGFVVVIVNVALMTYYLPIVGEILYYTVHSVLFTFMDPGFQAAAFWDSFINSPVLTVGAHTATAIAVAAVLALGIKRGIERMAKYMIPLMVIALVAVAIRGVTLSGGVEGLAFAFNPDWKYILKSETWIAALGQALFSTGLGWGVALTFGSYLRKHDDVPLGGALFTAVGNTSIGLLAIFAVFPVVFAFGLEPTAGTKLTFISLVKVFPQMPGGGLWAIVFFLGFFFAAFTSAFALTEPIVTTLDEELGFSRLQTVVGVVSVIWLLGIPSAISQDFLGTMDFMFGNWGLPIATLSIITMVAWKFRAERGRVLDLNRNSDIYIGPWWNPIVKYAIPAVMLFIMGYAAVTSLGTKNEVLMFGGIALMVVIVATSLGLAQIFDLRTEDEKPVVSRGD